MIPSLIPCISPVNVRWILIFFCYSWLVLDAVDAVICAPDDGWKDHPKHVEQFTDKINCIWLHLVGHLLTHIWKQKQTVLCNTLRELLCRCCYSRQETAIRHKQEDWQLRSKPKKKVTFEDGTGRLFRNVGTLRKIPEERMSHMHRRGSLKSCSQADVEIWRHCSSRIPSSCWFNSSSRL